MYKNFRESCNALKLFPDTCIVKGMKFNIPLLLRLLPRVLVDVSSIALSSNILGYTISAPIMIAPTALHKLAHPEGLILWLKSYWLVHSFFILLLPAFPSIPGELATARAAAACNTIMVHMRNIQPWYFFHFALHAWIMRFISFQTLSFSASCSVEEVAASCDAVRFFQLYVIRPP
jgi:(S)-2-hydroxy-acid oxidase